MYRLSRLVDGRELRPSTILSKWRVGKGKNVEHPEGEAETEVEVNRIASRRRFSHAAGSSACIFLLLT